MDFSTIKKKLQLNIYETIVYFISDVELVFENCILYNGSESQIWEVGQQIQTEWIKLKT